MLLPGTRGIPDKIRRVSPASEICFFVPGRDLRRLDLLDPDSDWQQLVGAGDDWITQTYLRLRDAGYPVRAIDEAPTGGVVVAHSRRLDDLLGSALHRSFTVVSIRAEVLPARRDADLEIVQNGRSARAERTIFIPVWPQAALIPRDRRRANQIHRVAFMGFAHNLHPFFRTASWTASLRERGIEWSAQLWSEAQPPPWNDFSSIDLILAVRPSTRRHYPNKPASKLVNAWTAGVPALFGPEIAFRELRRSDEDYVEIRDPREALCAIDKLLAEPERYRRMIENGRRRASDFSTAAVLERWVATLDQLASSPPVVGPWQQRWARAHRRSRLAASRTYRGLLGRLGH